jgi:hypothetical protein
VAALNGMLGELLRKSPTWLLAAAVLLLVLQSEGLIGHVFGGGGDEKQKADAQHAEQTRQLTDINRKLDGVTDQLRANGNSTAVGLRILCLQGAKTDQQRSECARIQ